MTIDPRKYGVDYYKSMQVNFKQLNPDSLADLYTNRPSRRVKLDGLLNKLEAIQEEAVEAALNKSDMQDAKDVLERIMRK